MEVIDFKLEHAAEARVIGLAAYREERKHSTFLPEIDDLPELDELAANGLGVAAFEKGTMKGFLSGYGPIDHFFGRVKGVFAPIHAHGVVGGNSDRLYAALYRRAADKWVERELYTHSIALYYHDEAAIRSFFRNGFGMRCIDAAAVPEFHEVVLPGNDAIVELHGEERALLFDLKRKLGEHLQSSPSFMPMNIQEDRAKIMDKALRYFAFLRQGNAIAMIGLSPEAETFVAGMEGVVNICDAYCLPEFRGTHVMRDLLQHIENIAVAEGRRLLGVDFESLNPAADRFWLKRFSAYTCSLTRRIDERING